MRENLEIVKEIFNIGKLKLRDARFYANMGYSIICGNGKVEEIIPPFNELAKYFVERMDDLC